MRPNSDYASWTREDLVKELKRIKDVKYGLVWHKDLSEEILGVPLSSNGTRTGDLFPEDVQGRRFPVLKEVKGRAIEGAPEDITHLLIEGDNYHALATLQFTHHETIDVIYIDPPYNTGGTDFKYNDKWVNSEDGYRHSKWLCFMEKRLRLAKRLLSDTGVIIAHIDENEVDNLYLLLCEVFGEDNDLGRIIWNKSNPKGDSKGVSILHETVLCFAKERQSFLSLEGVLRRPKKNAEKMIAKAKALFEKIGKSEIPADIGSVIRQYKFPHSQQEQFRVTYDLATVNQEFRNWLKMQGFSGGEAAYKNIDENGEIYRGIPMTWPSKKKKATEQYFKPLIHPVTKKPCPVPERGWRYPPATMTRLLEEGSLLFGPDEKKQPEKKGFLKDNIFENTPSIFTYSSSDDALFKDLAIDFELAKPLEVSSYLLSSIHPSPRIVLDFFAGSGTAGHAVLALNRDNAEHQIQFIVCTNDENGMCKEVCHPRLSKVMKGYKDRKGQEVAGYPGKLRYYKTAFVDATPTDTNRHLLVQNSTELICIKEEAFENVVDDGCLQVFRGKGKHLGILFDEEEIYRLIEAVRDIDGPINLYIFSLGGDSYEERFNEFKSRVSICAIPEVLLKAYREIFG